MAWMRRRHGTITVALVAAALGWFAGHGTGIGPMLDPASPAVGKEPRFPQLTMDQLNDAQRPLGEAIMKAAGDKSGIVRYGTFTVPMDEVLVTASLDLSGRPYFAEDLELAGRLIGTFDAELVHEFFQAVAFNALMNLHFLQHRGGNAHHVAEATFKAFGRALDAATQRDERVKGVPSTKGVL